MATLDYGHFFSLHALSSIHFHVTALSLITTSITYQHMQREGMKFNGWLLVLGFYDIPKIALQSSCKLLFWWTVVAPGSKYVNERVVVWSQIFIFSIPSWFWHYPCEEEGRSPGRSSLEMPLRIEEVHMIIPHFFSLSSWQSAEQLSIVSASFCLIPFNNCFCHEFS